MMNPACTDAINNAKRAFISGKTKKIDFRKQQLHQLLKCINENEKEFCEVLYKDLHKPKSEAIATELMMVRNEIVYVLNHVDEWARDEKASKTVVQAFTKLYIRKEPYGVCLIMSAWNYPVSLLLMPLVGAIAAGNCVIIKPSELATHTADAFQKLLPKYLDNNCYPVVVLDAAQSANLTKCNRFDMIFFTGGTSIGRHVMKAAAENLTPVVLELGGKNPCFLDSSYDLKVAARRIVWGRYSNAGQICLSPDYIMMHESIRDKFVEEVRSAIKDFFGNDVKNSKDYCRIINNRQFLRLKKLLQCGSGKIVIGGEMDEKNNYIAPTVVIDAAIDSPLMQEEMFGPIMLVHTVSNLESAIDVINKREKPLVLYMFSNDKSAINKMLSQTASGGVAVNDVLSHFIPHSLPFGGIGNSGMGAYHGKYSFEAFTHNRSCLIDGTPEIAFASRYPPFSDNKLAIVQFAAKENLQSQSVLAKISSFLLLSVLGYLLAYFYKYMF